MTATTPPATSGARPAADEDRRQAGRWWGLAAALVLPVVATVGAVLSWGSLYAAASTALGRHAPAPTMLGRPVNLAGAAFPLLVDALILGASARYVAGVKAGRPVGGWRLAAHAGVGGTILLNADAAPTLAEVPWHVTAPIVWSVLVELVARDALGELRETRPNTADRIPLRLWLTTPAESVRVSWRMARTGEADAETARVVTERCAAARDQLAGAVRGLRYRRLRQQITRRLWAGALDPATLAHLIDTIPDPAALHRAVLRTVATGTTAPDPDGGTHPDPEPSGPPVRGVPVAAVACRSGPVGPATVATLPLRRTADTAVGSVDPVTAREHADLTRITTAIANGRINGRVTKEKIRLYLRCSNPHAGRINALYQQQNTP